MAELTVWSVCVGDKYDSAYVYALKEAVDKHLTIPHQFRCITKRKLEGIQTVLPPVPYQGWWAKIGLFAPLVATGPSLYFDLDVVITGNINYLADYVSCRTLAAPANWAQSGHGGIQSSIMAWPGNWTYPYDRIKPLWPGRATPDGYRIFEGKKLWGDQEWLWHLLGDDWEKIPYIGSYKYHVRPTGKIPEWMKICVFHGEPKPIDIKDPCISSYTSTLRSLIKSSMDNGSRKGLSITA